MRHARSHLSSLLLVLALIVLGAALCALLVPAEIRAVAEHLVGFPDADTTAQLRRPLILAALCFLPTLAAAAYALGGTMDRYIVRQFLGIFGVCFSALLMIWLLLDLSDNIGDFRSSENSIATIVRFYGSRMPAVLMLLLPYSLLLSLLYCLGKLSTHREIIAIIQSGRGIFRLTLPLVTAGLFFTLFCIGINYHWAPLAEGNKDRILDEARGRPATEASHVVYRNPAYRRLWVIGTFPADYQQGVPLVDVEVTTTDENQQIVSRLSASHAKWDRDTRRWTFENALVGNFKPGSPPEYESPEGPLYIDTWPETPWQLIKPGLSAAYLGIPDLNSWLSVNRKYPSSASPAPYLTQWHYRWALPFSCLVTVLLATPLAIHFSRRGPGGGIFLAVVLSALMLLLSSIVLAVGEAGIIHPVAAAWLPNAAFALLAVYLYHRRITGRPIYHTLRRLLPGGAA
jgi:lipopolysaccharide export system permease protein